MNSSKSMADAVKYQMQQLQVIAVFLGVFEVILELAHFGDKYTGGVLMHDGYALIFINFCLFVALFDWMRLYLIAKKQNGAKHAKNSLERVIPKLVGIAWAFTLIPLSALLIPTYLTDIMWVATPIAHAILGSIWGISRLKQSGITVKIY